MTKLSLRQLRTNEGVLNARTSANHAGDAADGARESREDKAYSAKIEQEAVQKPPSGKG
jgi:hypothetical protein